MAQDASGAGAAAGRHHLVIPGEMAARVDRLPSELHGLGDLPDRAGGLGDRGLHRRDRRDGCTRSSGCRPRTSTHSQYDVLYAFQVGISILLGGYALGWLADKIGRRKALILSAALAGVFIWPFAYVTNYPALIRPVDRRHARVRRVPGHQRRVHERDHGPEWPGPG